ncbi:MAG: N-acetylmuramoyl-L-alanine amidase [Pseudomonadaceae bacterium]
MSSAVRLALLVCCSALLTACAPSLIIDERYQAHSQDSRVQYIVLHYTSSGFERSLHTLTQKDVSSHYLISDYDPVIYRLVDENQRAWHAGDSSWQGRTWLNSSSIGIELVHPGYTDQVDCRRWHDWDQRQIDALILLLRDIEQRHDIPPERVLAHSDIAPQRKVDPGPRFPWPQLVTAGVAVGADPQGVEAMQQWLNGRTPATRWFQQTLHSWGYAVPLHGELDEATRNVIAAFQMRFRPSRFDGVPDSETAALLGALVPEQASALRSQTVPEWYVPPSDGLPARRPDCANADD